MEQTALSPQWNTKLRAKFSLVAWEKPLIRHVQRGWGLAGKYAAEEAGGGGGEALCQPFSQPVGGVSDGEHAEGASRKPATAWFR